MNTTTAATEAHVTVATIRTWCRNGVVAATKVAGRWVIDTTSLAHRIAIGARRLARKTKTIVLTVANLKAIGGSEWIRGSYHRVYFNNWAELAGIEVSRYGTGNISSASIGGRYIANSRAHSLLGAIDKLYFDATDGQIYAQHRGATAYEVRYLDGDRDTLNLINAAARGIRAAVAAL